jgi:glycosyltransferase involved in cell wall biosynthesis
MQDKVTVIVPCYNSEKYIARCIRSILRQTIKPYQIIIVDDGSRDRTAQIAEKFPVEVIKHSYNKGLAAARNSGVRAAEGDIIFFVDSDCEMLPNNIEYVLEDFRKYHIDALCGQEIPKVKTTVDKYRAMYPQSWGLEKIINPPFLWGLCSAFKKDSLFKTGLFSSIFKTNGEDVDISLRMKRLGCKLLYDPRIKVFHLRTDNLISFLKSSYRSNYFGKLAYLKNSETLMNNYNKIAEKLINEIKMRIIFPVIKPDSNLNERIYFFILGNLYFIISKVATFNARYNAQRIFN